MHQILQQKIDGLIKPARKGVPFLIGLLLLFNFVIAQQVAKTSPAGTKMWVYTPPSYSTGTATHPVIVFLHGGGELGDDLTLLTTQTTNQYPPKLIATNKWVTSRPFIVVSPQLKKNPAIPNNDHIWPASYVNEVIQYVKSNYRVDASRIYLTGVSLGAAGAWDYAAAYPSTVAALLPISGLADAAKACAVKNIPIWVFHGGSDPLVPNSYPVNMVKAIKACSPVGIYVPRISLLHARNHEGWNEIYTGLLGPDIYAWFLKFQKNNTANKTPYVNANVNQKILKRTTSFHISGDYYDWDGTTPTVRWTKVSGPTVTMAGTTTAFLKLTGLLAGTYEFQLTATDNKGAVSSDRMTLTVVDALSGPAVTGLVLVNGKTNADIKPITEGMVINKTTLGVTEFNVRSIQGSGVYSVRFHVNNDQLTKVVNSPGPWFIKKPTTSPEWEMANGTYVICATPYPQTGGKGTAGIELCYKVSVTTTTTTTAASVSEPEEPVLIKAIDDVLASNVVEGNQWVLNGEDIEGATGSVYKPSAPGDYYVRIIDRPQYDISNSVKVDLKELQPRKPPLEVYPNPANDYILVRGESVPDNATFKVMRNNGSTILTGNLDNDNRITLPNALQKGAYILMIKTNSGSESIKFIID
jgi:predicted esterase